MLVAKILGIVLLIIGGWLAIRFPFSADYQTKEFQKTAMTIGLALVIIGVMLFLV